MGTNALYHGEHPATKFPIFRPTQPSRRPESQSNSRLLRRSIAIHVTKESSPYAHLALRDKQRKANNPGTHKQSPTIRVPANKAQQSRYPQTEKPHKPFAKSGTSARWCHKSGEASVRIEILHLIARYSRDMSSYKAISIDISFANIAENLLHIDHRKCIFYLAERNMKCFHYK